MAFVAAIFFVRMQSSPRDSADQSPQVVAKSFGSEGIADSSSHPVQASSSDSPAVATEPASQDASTQDSTAVEFDSAGVRDWRSLQDCKSKHQCPDGAVCAWTPRGIGCFRSNCMGLQDSENCHPSDSCISVGEGVFRCAPGGFRNLGDDCVDLQGASVERRCSPGLLCLGGKCSQRCRVGSSCPEGTICRTTQVGDYCVASAVMCDSTADCLVGQSCLQGAVAKVCARPATFAGGAVGCVPGGCPGEQVCAGRLRGAEFYGQCLPRCLHERCPPEMVCVPELNGTDHLCRRMCTPGGPECGSDANCVFSPEKGHGFCVVAEPYDRTVNAGEEQLQIFAGNPDSMPTRSP